MDEKDKKIIGILKDNSRLSTREISKKTGIPITTVHKRIRKLKEKKIIKKFTVELDNKQIGKNISAYVLVSADLKLLKQKNKTQYDVLKELKRIDCVEKADIVVGISDIAAFVRAKDVEELDKILLGKIQNIEGVSNTQTLIVIHE